MIVLLACAPFLAAPSHAFGQDIGVLGGANVSMVRFDPSLPSVYRDFFFYDHASVSQKTGLVAGVQFTQPLGHSNFKLVIEGLIKQTGITVEGDSRFLGPVFSDTDQIRLTWFEVPVMLAIPAGSKASIHGGMFFGTRVRYTEHYKAIFDGEIQEDNDLTGNDRTDLKTRNVGLAIGAQVQASRMIDVGGRFNVALSSIDNVVDSDFKSVRASGLSLFVVVHPKRR